MRHTSTLNSLSWSHFISASGSSFKENIGKTFREMKRGDWRQQRAKQPSSIFAPFTPSVITLTYYTLWAIESIRIQIGSVCVCVYFCRLRGVIGPRLRLWTGKRHKLYNCNCTITELFLLLTTYHHSFTLLIFILASVKLQKTSSHSFLVQWFQNVGVWVFQTIYCILYWIVKPLKEGTWKREITSQLYLNT